MNRTLQTRLERLETVAATIPRTGAELIREIESLPESEAAQWWDERTNSELEEMLRAGGHCWNFDRFSVAELERIAAGDLSPLEAIR